MHACACVFKIKLVSVNQSAGFLALKYQGGQSSESGLLC